MTYLAQGPFGKVSAPPGVSKFGTGIGAISTLLNVLVNLVIVAAGLFALINFILAGYGYMSAGGDEKKIQDASARIWQSLVGLLVVAASFVLAAIFGQLLFNDPTFLLKPRIFTP